MRTLEDIHAEMETLKAEIAAKQRQLQELNEEGLHLALAQMAERRASGVTVTGVLPRR